MMAKCEHQDFLADVLVTRLEDSGRFVADVRIQCTQCEKPFRFIGLPAGCDLNGASTSMDATEARLAIAPKGEVMPAVDGAPHGFSVRIDPDSEKMLPAIRINKLEQEIESLRAAVAKHHAQRLDDRCFLDDEELYAAFGLPPADVSTPPKEKMLANCARFIDQRCRPGSQWKSYQELEVELAAAREDGQIIENLYAALKALVCCINTSASAKGSRFEGEQARVCAVLVKTCQYSDATNALESARDRLAQIQTNRKA